MDGILTHTCDLCQSRIPEEEGECVSGDQFVCTECYKAIMEWVKESKNASTSTGS